MMFAEKARVLLILPQDVLDRARVLAGKTTTTLKLPVSLQNVLRALERFAAGQQVVLASCDEELVRRAGREHWSIINLESRPEAQAPAGREVADDGQLHLL